MSKQSFLRSDMLSETVEAGFSDKPSQEIVKLLSGTIWGTPGKTLYKHLQTAEKIEHIKEPLFFSLYRHSKLLCTVCLSRRITDLGRGCADFFYIRYFVANKSITGKGNIKTNSKASRNSIIKQWMVNIFAQGSRINNKGNGKAVFYAYVETENSQSMQLCSQYGFVPVRKMVTVPVSRFSPSESPKVRLAADTERTAILKLLKETYQEHRQVFLGNIFYKGSYYVYTENGQIVAGAQANCTRWAICHLPGASGSVLLKLLPRLPYLRRIINPQDFRYSAMEGFFCLPGYEYAIEPFIESIMHKQKNNAALFWFDTECPVYKMLISNCKLGLMAAINSSGHAHIIARGQGLESGDWHELKQKPAYISCFDLS
jgi:hypothetical protein